MCQANNDFSGLMQRIRQGDEAAAWELVDRYGEEIRRAVRRALSSRLRSKFDSLDFVQLVWTSFFRSRDQLDRFDSPEKLVSFLVAMSRNKVGMEVRRRLATEKYNLNRELSLDESKGRSNLSDHRPAPEEVAIAREQWARLLHDQPDHYRKIIELRLEGHSYEEIAATMQLAQSTVRRFLKKLLHESNA